MGARRLAKSAIRSDVFLVGLEHDRERDHAAAVLAERRSSASSPVGSWERGADAEIVAAPTRHCRCAFRGRVRPWALEVPMFSTRSFHSMLALGSLMMASCGPSSGTEPDGGVGVATVALSGPEDALAELRLSLDPTVHDRLEVLSATDRANLINTLAWYDEDPRMLNVVRGRGASVAHVSARFLAYDVAPAKPAVPSRPEPTRRSTTEGSRGSSWRSERTTRSQRSPMRGQRALGDPAVRRRVTRGGSQRAASLRLEIGPNDLGGSRWST